MIKVFIDGAEGTAGLKLEERLRRDPELRIAKINPKHRKNPEYRADLINRSDVTFLCLPDESARESVSLCKNPMTVIIDASTAHRVDPDWAYGLPELSEYHAFRIKTSNRITVPGCHATGFIAIVYPLIKERIIAADTHMMCSSLTGYSGGGKKMIAEYESENPPRGARPYALGLTHKHLPEMQTVCGLRYAPTFMPVVVPVAQGMLVSVPLPLPAEKLREFYKNYYADKFSVADFTPSLNMDDLTDTDKLELHVGGTEESAVVIARFDNLGKGAAGAAVQCMRIRCAINN